MQAYKHDYVNKNIHIYTHTHADKTIMTGNLIILSDGCAVTQIYTDRLYANAQGTLPPAVTCARVNMATSTATTVSHRC